MNDTRSTSDVRVDLLKNRLYCCFGVRITERDISEFFTRIRNGVAELQPGYNVVVDLSRCHLLELPAVPILRNIMHFLADNGVGDVVRIVDKQSTVYRQLVNLSARIRSYKPVYVDSPAAADAHLDRTAKRLNLRFNLANTWIAVDAATGAFTAKAIDVSLSGCAIAAETDTPLPAIGATIRIKLPLTDAGSTTRTFIISATVARMFQQGFAVSFTEFDNASPDEFRQCLIHELRQRG